MTTTADLVSVAGSRVPVTETPYAKGLREAKATGATGPAAEYLAWQAHVKGLSGAPPFVQQAAQSQMDDWIQTTASKLGVPGGAVAPAAGAAVPAPSAVAPAAGGGVTPGAAAGGGGFVDTSGAAGDLNVPFGADFLQPALDLYAQILGIGESKRATNQSAIMNMAQQLAALSANPLTAAESAFSRAGLGFNPFGGGGQLDIAALLGGAATRGAGTPSELTIGDANISVPGALSGAQTVASTRNRNAAGVMESFARAAGRPDLLERSAAALVPALFGGGGPGL